MKPLVQNHTTLHRQVRLNADFTVCDVFSIRRVSKPDDSDYQTTYQDPNEGTWLLVCNKHTTNIRVVNLNSTDIVPDEQQRTVLENTPSIIIEWLKDCTEMKHTNFIPIGYGWDGKFTRAEYQKRQRANLLFIPPYMGGSDVDRDFLDKVLDDICRTPKRYLCLNWNDASPMPDNGLMPQTEMGYHTTIITIEDELHHRVYKPKKVIAVVDGESKYIGDRIPNGVDKLIVLTHGIIVDEYGEMVGCSVQLYKRI